MDSLIRLDAVSCVSLSEGRPTMNIGSPGIDNLPNANLQQTEIDIDSSITIEEIPSMIDLTDSQESSPGRPTWLIDSNPPFINLGEVDLPLMNLDGVDLTASGAKRQAPTKHNLDAIDLPHKKLDEVDLTTSCAMRQAPAKHKLSPLSNHSPSKVPRITGNDFNFTTLDPSGNFESANRPTSSNAISYPITRPSLMKNHTVTSADFNDDVQEEPVPLNLAGPSRENRFVPCTNRQNIVPGQSLDRPGTPRPSMSMPNTQPKPSEPNNFLDSLFFNKRVLDTFPLENIQSNLVIQNTIQIDDDLDNSKEKESEMFYQILDMFPDIDLTFLKNQCHLGLDINQISELILEMNDYPKAKFETPDILPPKDVVEVNVNNNCDVLPNCTSSTDPLILADEVVPRMCDTKLNDGSSQINTSNATSSIVPTPTNINQHVATCQNYVNRKEENDITIISKNVQKTDEGILVDKDKTTTNLIKQEKKDPFETTVFQSNYSFLIEIFPDADPSYLELKSKLNENDLRLFIAESMEKRDYPKVPVANLSIKTENEAVDELSDVGLYTTNFDIENFLKIFPAPFEYFLDEKRNCQYSEHGLGFLKRRYRTHAIKLILSKYKEYEFNLVKTCAFLDAEIPTRVSKRSLKEIKMPEVTNLPFLQEACFIEHKTEIKTYLDSIAEAKRLAYDQAEANGELIECGCCYQDVLFEDCAACNEGHLFCKNCIRKSVEVRIGDAHTTFPCLIDCGTVFSLQLLEVLVDATMFSRLLQRIQMDEVMAADIEGLECCPFCEFAIILPPETNIFKCLNPECLKESCRKCHKLSHIPQRCEEIENDDQARARKYIEDEMTRALVRECYKCKKSFIKMDGCNKMTCTCGAKMCYICRQPIVDYKHFNGPGGEEKKKCPLYSTEKLLHVDAVEAVAKKALEEVNSKNPELKLKHDPTKILPPASSAKTILPPGVNEEAGRLDDVLRYIHGQAQQNEAVQNNITVIPEARIRPVDLPNPVQVAREVAIQVQIPRNLNRHNWIPVRSGALPQGAVPLQGPGANQQPQNPEHLPPHVARYRIVHRLLPPAPNNDPQQP